MRGTAADRGLLSLRRAGLAWQELHGRVVVLTLGNDVLHEFNDTGSAVFRWLWQEARSRAQLVDLLVDEFVVAPATARRDLEAFLADLAALGIVEEA